MTSIFEQGTRKIITDNGDHILQAEFPISQVYSDSESRRLSSEYNVHSHCGFVSSSLGSANLESLTGGLFRLYSAIGEFCGISAEDIGKFEKSIRNEYRLGRLMPEYLMTRKIEGIKVLFPTEEFLQNQKIKTRSIEAREIMYR